MDSEIVLSLVRQYPNAVLTTVEQPLSADDYAAQKHKHFSRRALGGAVGIIRDGDGRIVLAKRSGMHAGWALVGGTVEAGEDFAVAFGREVSEEVGITLDCIDLVELERKTFVSPEGESFRFLLAVFSARILEGELPPPTSDAQAEGLTVGLFEPSAIPAEMILGDREKLLRALESVRLA